jgi:hypothetical protein
MATSQPAPLAIVVKISPVPGGDPNVEPMSFGLSKKSKDTVLFECTDANAVWSVDFEPSDCPFGRPHFDKQTPDSGAVRGNAAEKQYKYHVMVSGRRVDPDVVVNP